MRHNASKIFAWILTFAMLASTFGSDFSSIITFAEGEEREVYEQSVTETVVETTTEEIARQTESVEDESDSSSEESNEILQTDENVIDNSESTENNNAATSEILETEGVQNDKEIVADATSSSSLEMTESDDLVIAASEASSEELSDVAAKEASSETEGAVKMPAQNFSGGAGGIHVEVSAGEGVFPEGTTMVVTPISSDEAIQVATDAKGDAVVNAIGVDISFRNADGVEIEPADFQNVHVSMELMNSLEGNNFTVLHKDDAGNVEEIAEANADGAEFDHNSFSIFIVVSEDQDDHENNAVATYTFYTDESLETEFNKQLVKTGDKLADPGIPTIHTGEEFVGWFYKDGDTEVQVTFGEALNVSQTAEYNVYAKIRTTYYVTFIGNSGEVAQVMRVEGEKGASAIASVSGVSYTPKNSTQAFLGWSLVKDDKNSIVTEVDASISSQRTLYAIIINAYWIHFDENDDIYEDGELVSTGGASFTSPIYVMTGETATEPAAPTRDGYTFNGWYYGTKNADGSVTLNEAFDWSTVITDNLTLYASWTAEDTTQYTVILWQQKITDAKDTTDNSAKTYDYKESFTLTGQTDQKLTEDDITEYKDDCDTGFHYSWYEIVRLKNGVNVATDKIRAAGDTVINVYFDRDLMTITFKYYSNKKWNDYGEYTGLYGKTLTSEGYEWPDFINGSHYKWYTDYVIDKNKAYGAGEHVTFLDTFFENVTLYGIYDNDGKYTVSHYKQALDGTYDGSSPTNYTPALGGGWTFTNKYEGFTVKQYYLGKSYSTDEDDWESTAADEYIKFYQNLYIRYERNKYSITFKDNFNGKTSTVSADEAFDGILYEMPLNSYEEKAPVLDDRDGYKFIGWYEDQNGQKAFDWNTIMPAANKVVYAYYQPIRYKVVLHTNGGTLTENQKETFNLDYGDVISRESLFKTTKTGYELVGWFDKDGVAYSFDKVTGEASYKDENGIWWGEQIDLYALWRNPGTVSVYYDASPNGSIDTQPDTYTYASESSAVVGPPPTTVDEGYVFIGWELVGDSSGKTYYPNNSFKLADGTIEYNDPDNEKHGTVTLKAKYEKTGGQGTSTEQTTITYVANNETTDKIVVSTNAKGEALKVNESVEALPDTTFTYAGHTFVEWNTSADGTGLSVPAGTKYIAADNKDSGTESSNTKANILYAIWSNDEAAYDITLQAIGGTTTYNGQEHNVEGFVVSVDTSNGLSARIGEFLGDLFNLTVNAQNVSEKAGNSEFTIDGKTYTVTEITSGAKGTDADTYVTAFEGTAIILCEGEDVTDMFNISYKTANLVINPRNITFTSGTSSKTYDGTALTNSNVSIGGDGFAGNDSATFTVTGSQTAVGTSSNVFTFVINGKASNYIVTKIEGTLTVVTSGGTTPSTDPTPDPTPTTTATTTTTPTAAPAVLGARRETEAVATQGPAVLGARRGGTDDTTNTGIRLVIILACAGAASLLALFGKSKKNDAK